MAVWIQIIGLRKLESKENEKDEIFKILNETEFNFDFIQKKSGIKLDKPKWNLTQSRGMEFFELPILDQSLKIYFDHPNFIEFSGSFDLFSSWIWFTDKQNSDLTTGIRNIFRKIASIYGISELYYFSEWFFGLDGIKSEEETIESLEKQIKNNSEFKKQELFGLESNEYYLEKITPSNL